MIIKMPEPAVVIAAGREKAKAEIVAWFDALTATVENQYPSAVRKAWVEEEDMAAAFLAGTENQQQLDILTACAEAKGRTVADHAARILQNAQLFRSIATATRQLWLATDALLDAATEPTDFDVIVSDAKSEGASLAAAFGLPVPG